MNAARTPKPGTTWLTVAAAQTEVHAFGFCVATRSGPSCNHQRVNRAQVRLCCDWLQTFGRKTKTIRRQRSSYGYKHEVERWASSSGKHVYISNGAFIVAAKRAGYTIEQADHALSPNAFFNLAVAR